MTDIVSPAAGASAVNRATRRDIGIKRRYAAERRFRAYGIAAISFGLIFLFLLAQRYLVGGISLSGMKT